MRLQESKIVQFLENIPKSKKIFLLHGTVDSKVWYYLKLIEIKLLEKQARKEMRLVTLNKTLLNKEKHLLINEMKTRSFFGGAKGIILENVSEKETNLVMNVLESLDDDDPFLIMTSGFLSQSSKLRKAIENNIHSCSVGLYQEEMTMGEIQSLLQRLKLKTSEPYVIETLREISKNYDFLEFRQELKKLALFKSFDETSLSINELEKVFSSEANPNEKRLIDDLMQRQEGPIIDFFKNHVGNIKNPVSVITRAAFQFRILHRILCNEGNELNFLRNIWPPIFGKNKEQLIKNTKIWQFSSIENALRILKATDLKLRLNHKISSKTLLIYSFLEICQLKK